MLYLLIKYNLISKLIRFPLGLNKWYFVFKIHTRLLYNNKPKRLALISASF